MNKNNRALIVIFSFMFSVHCYSMQEKSITINDLEEINHPREEEEKALNDFFRKIRENEEIEKLSGDMKDNGEFWEAWLMGDSDIPFSENMNELPSEMEKLNSLQKNYLVPLSKYYPRNISGKSENIHRDYYALKQPVKKIFLKYNHLELFDRMENDFNFSISRLETYARLLLKKTK